LNILEIVLFFIFGLSIGSFLNVIIYRLPQNKNLLGRSYCDNCKRKIFWFDLVPIVSYLFLKGRCRFCKNKIDWQIPIVELSTAFLFVSVFLKFPILTDFKLWFYLFVVSSLIAIFFIDLRNGMIPDKIIYPVTIIALLFVIFSSPFSFLNFVFSGVISFLFFLIIFLVTHGKGMGFGDVKLATVLGLILGFPKIIISLYLAFLTGGILSLILILWGKKRFKKDTIAFGPFLAFSALLTIFLGDKLVLLLSSFL